MTNSRTVTLADGTRVVLEHFDHARSCSVYVSVSSGSSFEKSEDAGISHFAEHIFFKGTEKRSAQQIMEQMDEIGADLNAYTAREVTSFYTRALSYHLDTALDILFDMVTNPRIDANDVEHEKGVILEEYAMYEDYPSDVCYDNYYEGVWRANPLGMRVLGTPDTINAVTPEKLRKHLDTFFTPNRIVISVCGSFDDESVLKKCNEYFGSSTLAHTPIVYQKPVYESRFITVPRDFEQNYVVIGFPGYPKVHDERYERILLTSVLGGSQSSRLFSRIREELGLVYSIECESASYMNSGLLMLSMGVSPKSEEQAIRETVKIVREAATSITEKELARAKEFNASQLCMALESVSHVAGANSRDILFFGSVEDPDEEEARLRSVSVDAVREFADKAFSFENVSFCCAGRARDTQYYEELVKGL